MLGSDLQFINEEFFAERLSPEQIDKLWAEGWRHFGGHFFRYNLGIHDNEIRRVQPLRIDLSSVTLTKSQRRILRRNDDLDVSFGPLSLTRGSVEMFERHKQRFKFGIPESIHNFLPPAAEFSPCETLQLNVFSGSRLVAQSFVDVGATAISGVYGMYEPDEAARGLGIFTMLKEIEFARAAGKRNYYLGYSYSGASFYDYKKRFKPLQVYDWQGQWLDHEAYTQLSGWTSAPII